jgi:hypothetical protein
MIKVSGVIVHLGILPPYITLVLDDDGWYYRRRNGGWARSRE